MNLVSTTTMTLFPLTDAEFYTEMYDGEHLYYQIDKTRIPPAMRSELVAMALLNEDCEIPAPMIVDVLANLNAVYALMIDPYSADDVSLCVYVCSLGAYAEMDLALDDDERCYIGALVG